MLDVVNGRRRTPWCRRRFLEKRSAWVVFKNWYAQPPRRSMSCCVRDLPQNVQRMYATSSAHRACATALDEFVLLPSRKCVCRGTFVRAIVVGSRDLCQLVANAREREFLCRESSVTTSQQALLSSETAVLRHVHAIVATHWSVRRRYGRTAIARRKIA